MAPKFDPKWRQEDFIFDLNWCSRIEDDFIDYLTFEARIGNFIWPRRISRALVHAINRVFHNHDQHFSYAYLRVEVSGQT